MRGNSGFLRWLPSITSSSSTNRSSMGYSKIFAVTVLSIFLAALITPLAKAGPINNRSTRMTRDFYSDFEVNAQNDSQPAGTCLQNGAQVSRSSVQCEKKSGCREIQKTGYCCPDFQCDCETGNKTYLNGEKLLDHENPCKVCYCQGGEITCIDLKCYVRNDCEPKYTPGICCPDYDNCPPLEDVKPTMSKEIVTTESESSSSPFSSFEQSTTPTVKQEIPNGNPLGIKIKETTKAEEIRIIDEKPKQTYQLTKPFESSSSNQPKSYPPNLMHRHEQTIVNNVDNNHSDNNAVPSSSQNNNISKSNGVSDGVSHEVFNKLENTDVNFIDDEDTLKIVRHTNTLNESAEEDNSAGNNSTETTETTSKDPAMIQNEGPTVMQNGGKVVVVDQNGQKKPFTVFGVEGLQRGDVNDELTDYDEKKITSKRSDMNPNIVDKKPLDDTNTEDFPVISELSTASNTEILLTSNESYSNETETIYKNDDNDDDDDDNDDDDSDEKTNDNFEPIASSSDDFVRIIITTKKPQHDLMNLAIEGSGSLENSNGTDDKVYETLYYTSNPLDGVHAEDDVNLTDIVYETVYHQPEVPIETDIAYDTVYREPEGPIAHFSTNDPSSIKAEVHMNYNHNPTHYPVEVEDENPEYPTIRETDLSIHKDVHSLGTDEDDIETSHNTKSGDAKILHDIDEFRSNSSKAEDADTSSLAPTDWLKQENSSTTEDFSHIEMSSESTSESSASSLVPKQRSPGEPHLVPEWERNSSEVSALNESLPRFIEVNKESDEISSTESIEIDDGSGSGSGSGSGAPVEIIQKDKEPTTPRISKFLNNDDIESFSDNSDNSTLYSIKHDPKEDVESLKDEESNNDEQQQPVIKYAANPALQRTFEALHNFNRFNLFRF